MTTVAVDYGRRRTGLASIIAGIVLPLEPVSGGWTELLSRLHALSEPGEALVVVLGLPLSASGRRTELCEEVESLAGRLRLEGFEVVLERETGTTAEARASLPGRWKRDGALDSLAAVSILKRHLHIP
jgi:RNase H-fold protein (predicted Holliday junction resolvase)